MPSRLLILVILTFWLAIMGWFVARDVAPRWRAGDAPPYAIELADEALKNPVAVKWRLVRNGKEIGKLNTRMVYKEAENVFELTAESKQIDIVPAGPVQVAAREFSSTLKVNHDGELRGILAHVEFEALGVAVHVGVTAEIKAGRIDRTCLVKSPAGTIMPRLDPVAYRGGMVLNPMHPVNRVAGLKAGQRWRIPLIDPFADALQATVAEMAGAKLSGPTAEPVAQFLYAEVLGQTQDLEFEKTMQSCVVIEYTGDDSSGRTWVRASDGLVLRQEAQLHGESLVLQRADSTIPP
jgi:hypothetical protein